MKNVIVIPVYKDTLTRQEELSLKQCVTILNKHDIVLISHRRLVLKEYEDIFNLYHKKLEIIYFEDHYFSSVSGYNRLMLSRFFYETFSQWDYMLIYQLDAFVFKDELNFWVDKGYDYIGAPWMKLNGRLDKKNSGNGGFSLRKITSFIHLFEYEGKLLNLAGLQCLYRYRGPIRKPLSIVKGLFGWHNSLNYFIDTCPINEDLFYVTLKHKIKQPFKIPDSAISMRFSFEENPSLLYHLSGEELPFGCHAWEINQYKEFWSRFIKL